MQLTVSDKNGDGRNVLTMSVRWVVQPLCGLHHRLPGEGSHALVRDVLDRFHDATFRRVRVEEELDVYEVVVGYQSDLQTRKVS